MAWREGECRSDRGLTHAAASFSVTHRLVRVLWRATWLLLASWTPPSFQTWRCAILRAFGAKVGRNVNIRGTARVWYPANLTVDDHVTVAEGVNCYNMAPVSIGSWAIVSQGATLCAGTHDVDSRNFQLIVRPIVIEAYCWVASEAFVGPGVTLHEGAVLGARGVAFRDLSAWTINAGNPARRVRDRVRFLSSDEGPEADVKDAATVPRRS